MIVLEMKAVVKPSQCSAIDEAIPTVKTLAGNYRKIERKSLSQTRKILGQLN